MNRQTILLVEDSEDDTELACYALAKCRVPVNVVALPTGEAALDYLTEAMEGAVSKPRPDLMLLDLQLPGISGLEVLRRMRAHPEIRRTLVVMLTTSDDERDICASYDLGANSYIRKPVELSAFSAVLDQLSAYWLQTNTCPPQ